MSIWQASVKRGFDILLSAFGLLLLGWLILLTYVMARIDTGASGFFRQERVGRFGRTFKVIKLRTMRDDASISTTITTGSDPRITRLGRILRKLKIDELPQLINVLVGQMSFVGPRPDVPGYADQLQGEDRIILSVRPGITGPATLRYRDEEALLASVNDPEDYNRTVVYPEKVRLNREYVGNWSFWQDIRYILATLFGKL